ncbi:MAG: hypothetical protein ACREOJ_11440 [Gemmatimonadaceae bacterium]
MSRPRTRARAEAANAHEAWIVAADLAARVVAVELTHRDVLVLLTLVEDHGATHTEMYFSLLQRLRAAEGLHVRRTAQARRFKEILAKNPRLSSREARVQAGLTTGGNTA